MSSMDEVLQFLSKVPGLKEAIGMDKAMAFVRLAALLKDEIILAQKSSYDPSTAPNELPEHVRTFLGGATDMPDQFVTGCWAAFNQTIWAYEAVGSSSGKDAQMFRDFGLDHLLSARMLFPPSKTCTTPGCLNTSLLREKDGLAKVVLFTLSDGACATYAGHLHCRQCRTNYYNNYSVRDGIRTYYADVPAAIQVSQHHFIEREPETCPEHKDWPPERSFKMCTEHVWDGFLILSLLEDYEQRDRVLSVPDTGEQSVRFTEAMPENGRIIATNACGYGRRVTGSKSFM
ncbi:hypothetical protein DFH09DRAFT_1475350 [Mycena vulgaris]|nr:hypothetical protein DFH09DRAFT_1475350 [Mycena vulgaris]